MKLNKLLLLIPTLAVTLGAGATIPINGTVESKCVIMTDTDGVYGNPTADKLSTTAADGGVVPIIRYDIITASAYKAVITTPNSFSNSPELPDVVNWSGATTVGQTSDASMSAFETGKVIYNNSTEFDLSVAGSVWFNVSSIAEYGYDKALPAGNYTAFITAECVAQ
jgi:hypothetical protein|tara:strand:- start:3050 stop:3550 length:501 start_codon:yes stop_codon:yes gene_type:complete